MMLAGLDTHNTVKYHSWPNSYTSSLFERVPVGVACNALISVKRILIVVEITKNYFEERPSHSFFSNMYPENNFLTSCERLLCFYEINIRKGLSNFLRKMLFKSCFNFLGETYYNLCNE